MKSIGGTSPETGMVPTYQSTSSPHMIFFFGEERSNDRLIETSNSTAIDARDVPPRGWTFTRGLTHPGSKMVYRSFPLLFDIYIYYVSISEQFFRVSSSVLRSSRSQYLYRQNFRALSKVLTEYYRIRFGLKTAPSAWGRPLRRGTANSHLPPSLARVYHSILN